ncbi:MAG TPA: hypothetical protein VM432_01405, partial [Bdellovibrionales bacterium]|nr:hypothetical protein [Bdellovibrionales bacterium]
MNVHQATTLHGREGVLLSGKLRTCKCLVSLVLAVSLGVPFPASAQPNKWRQPAQARPEAAPIQDALKKESSGKVDDALKTLSKIVEKEKEAEKRALARFAKAVVLDRSGRVSEADAEYTAAITDGLRVSDYAYFHRGVLRKKQGMLKEARQ